MMDKPNGKWEEYLQSALFSMSNQRNLGTDETPTKLLLGDDPK